MSDPSSAAALNAARGLRTARVWIPLMLLLLTLPGVSRARLLLEDQFDGKGPGVARGGEFVTQGGITGWISGTTREPHDKGFSGSDVVTYDVRPGVHILPEQGTVVLDLVYWRKGGREYGKRNATYSTLVDFLNPDGSTALLLYGVWEGYYGDGDSTLAFWAPGQWSDNVNRLYGKWVPLGKRLNVGDRVQPGQQLLSLTQTGELWVTERDLGQIEVFGMSNDNPPKLTASDPISIPNGPEALIIDDASGKRWVLAATPTTGRVRPAASIGRRRTRPQRPPVRCCRSNRPRQPAAETRTRPLRCGRWFTASLSCSRN